MKKLGVYHDGVYRKNIVQVSSGSTAYDIAPEESGATFWLNTATTLNFRLPRISSHLLGLTYELAIQEQASSDDVRVTCNTFDSSAIIQTAFSSIVDNHTTAIPASTFFTGARLTAVSTIVWMLEQITAAGYAFSSAATDAVGGWTTG